MNATTRILLLLSLVCMVTSLMKSEFGAVYDHFKADPLEFTESDLHLLADAFYIKSHFSHAQQADLLSNIKTSIGNATSQTAEIGKLIDSTSSLIKVVKDTINTVSNPGSMISNAFKGGLKSMFGRRLGDQTGAVTQVVQGLENKVIEAKANQQSITNALSTSQKFLAALQGVGELLSGNTAGFKNYLGSFFGGKRVLEAELNETELNQQNVKEPNLITRLSNLFQNAGAHLEHLAVRPDESKGRHRKSLYQLRTEKDRLLRMSISAKRTARYLNGVDETSIDFGKVENHLWDLVQDGGATGKAYLRGVETLKCILLNQGCPETLIIPAPANGKLIYFGKNANQANNADLNGNLVIQTGTSTEVQSGSLNNNANQDSSSNEQVYVQPGLLTGQNWNIDSVSSLNNRFNSLQGNEGVIIQNESQMNRIPPITDLASSLQSSNLSSLSNKEDVSQTYTYNKVEPSQESETTVETRTYNTNTVNQPTQVKNEADFDKVQSDKNDEQVIEQTVKRNLNGLKISNQA